MLTAPSSLIKMVPVVDKAQEENLSARSHSKRKKRKDRFGRTIGTTSKKHRISFKDEIEKQSLNEIFFVESYKKYNTIEDTEEQTSCHCSLL